MSLVWVSTGMTRLRLLGFLGALVIATLAVGALGGAALSLADGGARVLSSGVVFALVAVVAVAVVVTGSTAARTLDSTYW
jgi:hypothetical protein